MLKNRITLIDANGGHAFTDLHKSFFNVGSFNVKRIDGLFRGMIDGMASEVDNEVTGEVRNRLLANREQLEQLDLVPLNIQRGRDHGVPLCNSLRE